LPANGIAARARRAFEASPARRTGREIADEGIEAGRDVDGLAGLRRLRDRVDASTRLRGVVEERRIRERHDELLDDRLAAVHCVEAAIGLPAAILDAVAERVDDLGLKLVLLNVASVWIAASSENRCRCGHSAQHLNQPRVSTHTERSQRPFLLAQFYCSKKD
jgi:hypothetical protein